MSQRSLRSRLSRSASRLDGPAFLCRLAANRVKTSEMASQSGKAASNSSIASCGSADLFLRQSYWRWSSMWLTFASRGFSSVPRPHTESRYLSRSSAAVSHMYRGPRMSCWRASTTRLMRVMRSRSAAAGSGNSRSSGARNVQPAASSIRAHGDSTGGKTIPSSEVGVFWYVVSNLSVLTKAAMIGGNAEPRCSSPLQKAAAVCWQRISSEA
mmetsp:Transcript_28834/g.73098  ORF Transcript_28834/g.73098 Transcript_28834/m.73098 type:complete len:212 (+) Transcript_28834:436-1071(+)